MSQELLHGDIPRSRIREREADVVGDSSNYWLVKLE